jgi:uncharacterized protein YraI
MRTSRFLRLAASASLLVSSAASAQTAWTSRRTSLRAGPSADYPFVAALPAGVSVTVAGCLNDWSWCDVSVPGARGWAYARYLDYPYEDGRVPIFGGGIYLGLPILTFSIGPYWDAHYRGRPWYGRRDYWYRRPPPRRWIGPRPHAYPFSPPERRPRGWHPPGWRPFGGHPPAVRDHGPGAHPPGWRGDRRGERRPPPARGVRPEDRRPPPAHPDDRRKPPPHGSEPGN